MLQELPKIVLKGKELRKYRYLKKKYPVTREFLHSNWANAKRFIIYALNPRCILRNYAWRKRDNRILIVRRVRLLLFDPRLKRMIRQRKENIKQWSRSVVQYYKKKGYVTEYEETELYGEELSKQMKQQLELLKNSKRSLSLIEDATKNVELRQDTAQDAAEQSDAEEKKQEEIHVENKDEVKELVKPEIVESAAVEETATKETIEDSPTEISSLTNAVIDTKPLEKLPEKSTEMPGGSKFLDMLMNKVRVKNFAKESNFFQQSNCNQLKCPSPSKPTNEKSCEFSDDMGEDFVGFDETAHQPGMLLTPLVPQNCKTVDGNAAFVSESLEAYMKENKLRDTHKLEPMYEDGRVTRHCVPPHMDMPAVPESLQRLRTVAERRLYLQRCKNQKMTIINNEANIYRELQRKQRQRKVKMVALQQLQSSGSQMPFTRQGWQAASYVATENDKYYYQVIRIDGEMVRLPGSQGNNVQREKRPHRSQVLIADAAVRECPGNSCPDAALRADLKVLPTKPNILNSQSNKLNHYPLPAIFRPCPLSQKPYQKPLDDDTAALLLAGGSMAVVSMPTVQLDVKPQLGRPLDEIAKRYLQHILPHHDITREWAEFCVSTLQESPRNMREAEAHAAKRATGRRKSFTFVIPYLNDRNHILVRRVVDRSEKLDESFSSNQPAEKLQEFEFRNQLTSITNDPIERACADMISEMINTVAISCSENSFIFEDPDALRGPTPEISPSKEETVLDKADKTTAKLAAVKQQQRRPNKQQRLAKELRRLNATIIDAAAIAKDANKPCLKDHCQLGCLCESLTGKLPAREHCGRAECVLGCQCTGAELTRIMRVETDGCGISNEDAFNLRRKATARLAKMEKDFTSTLVLTDNETLLISDTQCDKKRRCTKAPKRYEDFADSIEDDEEVLQRPSKVAKREVSQKRMRTSTDNVHLPLKTITAEPYSVKDTDFRELKHCQVLLNRLPDVANLATFCMTHQLYKCFCGGLATDGKPIIIEKHESDAAIGPYVPELATRAHYSFERAHEEPQQQQPKQHLPPPKKRRKDKAQELNNIATNIIKQEPKIVIAAPREVAQSPQPAALPPIVQSSIAMMPTQRSPELDIIFSYYRSSPLMSRRVISVPRKCFLRLNRRRIERTRQEVARMETRKTQELLDKRILGAVRFYRAELDQQRRLEQQQQQQQQEKQQQQPSVILVRDDSDESEASNLTSHSSSSRKRAAAPEDVLVQEQPQRKKSLVAPVKEKLDKLQEKPQQQLPALKSTPKVDILMPKISGCYSLNANAVISEMAPPTATDSHTQSNIDLDYEASSAFRTSYNDVIQKMNTHVSKKMQDIDMALQRESKIIPTPNEEILCIIKWTNFLAAFESDNVFIWDVQMKNHRFLAATISNMMPAVCGAIAVVNTRFSPDPSGLPLMAKMLLEGKRNANTALLAVVMQGRTQYWLVKGFLRYMEGNACTKPTPVTHPILTKKINVLCTLMVKQRFRDKQRKQQTDAPSTSNNKEQPTVAPVAVPSTKPLVKIAPAPAPAKIVTLPAATLPPTIATNQSKDTALNIRSNIEFRKVLQVDVGELQIPELHDYDHRWVVLNLYDDFSHIFVPAFRDMISLDRIHNVVRVAHESKKVVKLQFFQDAPYDAFVTPSSKRKIYFGPLRLDMQPPVLVLLQSVDGKMMLREVYQREHNISVQRDKRTMAFWVLQINKQVHFEIDMSATPIKTAHDKAKEANGLQTSSNNDDDDCVIIDDEDDDDDANDDTLAKEVALVQHEKEQNLASQKIMNFSIESSSSGNLLITATPPQASAAAGGAVKEPQLGGFVPFIANVPATGSKAPITQFLTPQVQLTQTAAPIIVAGGSSRCSAEASATTPPMKISRISVQRCATAAEAPAATATAATSEKQSKETPVKINESLQKLLSNGNSNFKLGTGSTGVTITKLAAKETTPPGKANSVVEPIRIGQKRTLPMPTAATPEITAAAKTATAASGTSSLLKQAGTTISIGNLPLKVSLQPAKKPLSKQYPELDRRLAAASEPRQSLPAKLSAKQTETLKLPSKAWEPRKSLPGKLPAGAHSLADNQLEWPKSLNPNTASYGYLEANKLPRFKVKYMDKKFMVKIPNEGVLSFKSFHATVIYLNRLLSRTDKFTDALPGDWKFIAIDNPVQNTIKQSAANKAAKLESTDQPVTPIVIED